MRTVVLFEADDKGAMSSVFEQKQGVMFQLRNCQRR